ncbi:DUF6069 family protein [Actinorugispora endophytica]|uniref:Uncharacterized protein n=1 Tax=Actinorugispora endophytica TaxID=1605990 RepID=A0A4R6V261_9ACTN|nr:DUF6069 family protein [Actinorugispora endophytica]TDQ54244.1 hypothetical protein EV190_10277 [Actinorugispora endophytica]
MSTSQPVESHVSPTPRRPGLPWWQAGLLGVAGAVAANLVLLGVGHLAGASMTHPDETGQTVGVTVGGVAFMSVLPLAVGFAAAVALSLLWKGFLRTAQITGAALALVSAAGPLLLEADTPTRVVLALMHVVMAPAVWLSLETVRRRVLAG